MHEEKNLPNLLKAVKDSKNIKLKIVGKGELKDEILKLKDKYSLDLEIIESVPNSKLPEIYNWADIYIQPSLYEGNPKTILEAMSCGLPVIASNVEGINSVIKNHENGCLCEINIKSIKNSISEIIENKTLRETIGNKARSFIEENYDLKKTIKNELTLYHNSSK